MSLRGWLDTRSVSRRGFLLSLPVIAAALRVLDVPQSGPILAKGADVAQSLYYLPTDTFITIEWPKKSRIQTVFMNEKQRAYYEQDVHYYRRDGSEWVPGKTK